MLVGSVFVRYWTIVDGCIDSSKKWDSPRFVPANDDVAAAFAADVAIFIVGLLLYSV